MGTKYKVIQWGLGYAGIYSAGYILRNPHLELVGAKCVTTDKDGKDVGELCGMRPAGVKATRDAEALLRLEADCVIYMPLDPLTDPSVPGSSCAEWFNERQFNRCRRQGNAGLQEIPRSRTAGRPIHARIAP